MYWLFTKIIALLIILNFSLLIDNCVCQWFRQNSGTTQNLRGVYFVDANTGCVVGFNATILRTTNGGINWARQASGDTNHLLAVHFTTSSIGTSVGSFGTILRTTNAGLNWMRQYSPRYVELYSVSFINANTGLIAGGGATILHTINGGSNWILQYVPSPTNASLQAVVLLDTSRGWTAGSNQEVFRTSDGGLTWWQMEIGINSSWLYAMSFLNTLRGIIVGDNVILRTTDGGTVWYETVYPGAHRGVSLADAYNGTIVGGGGRIVRTTNGGVNWFLQSSGTTAHLFGVVMLDSYNGYVVGDSGIILHTTNGGFTGVNEFNNEVPAIFQLYQNYPNPFNATTQIKYSIPQNAKVQIKIYNVVGEEVAELVNEFKTTGNYTVRFDGTNFASGVYFYKIIAGEFTDAKRMVFIR